MQPKPHVLRKVTSQNKINDSKKDDRYNRHKEKCKKTENIIPFNPDQKNMHIYNGNLRAKIAASLTLKKKCLKVPNAEIELKKRMYGIETTSNE